MPISDAERRGLVFRNIANGVGVDAVARAFQITEAQVDADLRFVASKVRSYRFQRGERLVPCETVSDIRTWRFELLYTLARLNLDSDPKYRKIVEVPFELGTGGAMSDAERLLISGLKAS